MERELEVKNGEMEDLNWKLGVRKEAEARADKRYKRSLEYNREVEIKVEELKKRFQEELTKRDVEVEELRAKLMEKEVELGDLKEQLKISGNLEAERTDFQIIVKTLIGKTIPMRVEPFWTVACLKSNIENKECISQHVQCLIIYPVGKSEKILEDGQTLAYYNIQKDSIIKLVLRIGR